MRLPLSSATYFNLPSTTLTSGASLGAPRHAAVISRQAMQLSFVMPHSIVAVIGANALTIYLLYRFIPFGRLAGFLLNWLGSGPWQAFAVALTTIGLEWLLLFLPYRKRIFLRV